MNWIWILFLLALAFVAIDYARLTVKVKRLEGEQMEREPVRHVFIGQRGSAHVKTLLDISINAHIAAGVKTTSQFAVNDMEYLKIKFDNGDEIIAIQYGEHPIDALNDVPNYINRVFFDEELPDCAVRECIEKLGLKNYMFSFGIVQKGAARNGKL